jgi:DNA-binding HxlR family transcriptional regulator
MDHAHRSGCPINLSLELFGDKWSLLVLRDMIFGGKRHFRELLKSEEGIASNILADRLKMLVEEACSPSATTPATSRRRFTA